MDLPHLCLNNQTTYVENKKEHDGKYTITKGNYVNEYTKSSLNVLTKKAYIQKSGKDKLKNNGTRMPVETKQIQYSKRQYDDLIKKFLDVQQNDIITSNLDRYHQR